MQFLDSVQVVLVQNLFWWTVMCSSLAILLRFFIITSLADLAITSRSQSKTGKSVRMSDAAAWVVVHGGTSTSRDGCNFLVSGSGEVAEGRGWGIAGITNNTSIDIYLTGNNQDEPPPKKQVKAVQELISSGVSGGHIAADYKLFHHKQFLPSTTTSGSLEDRLYSIIQQWPRFAAHAE